MKHLMIFESFFRRGDIDPSALQLVKIGGAVNPALGFLMKRDVDTLTEAGIETEIVGEISPKDDYAFWDVNGILSDPCYVTFTHSGRDNSLMKKEINFEISPGKIYHQQKGDWVKVTPRDFISSLSTRNS